jgi:hypothetical protein
MRGGHAREAALPAAASAVSTAKPHAEFILMAGRTACKEGPAYRHLPTPETQLWADRSAFERVVQDVTDACRHHDPRGDRHITQVLQHENRR